MRTFTREIASIGGQLGNVRYRVTDTLTMTADGLRVDSARGDGSTSTHIFENVTMEQAASYRLERGWQEVK